MKKSIKTNNMHIAYNKFFSGSIERTKGSRKKISFSGQSIKAFSPPPLCLVVKRMATNLKKKVVYSSVDNPLPP